MRTGWRSDNGNYRVYQVFEELVDDKVPAGIYEIGRDPIGHFLKPTSLVTDKLLLLPEGYSTQIIAEFARFWQLRDAFTQRGFIHKRGFLLHGVPGCGKTALVSILARKVVEEQSGIVIVNMRYPGFIGQVLKQIRTIEPLRPVVVVLEDIDAIIDPDKEDDEPALLSLLDGETQVDGVIYLATTNHIGKLPPRIVNRPSRFDTVMEIGMPFPETREAYFKAKEPGITKDELREWVKATEGLGIAHLKEVITAVKCFGQRVESVVDRLRRLPLLTEEK